MRNSKEIWFSNGIKWRKTISICNDSNNNKKNNITKNNNNNSKSTTKSSSTNEGVTDMILLFNEEYKTAGKPVNPVT